MLHYSISAVVLMKWSTFCYMKGRLAMLVKRLETDVRDGHFPSLDAIKPHIEKAANLVRTGDLWKNYVYSSTHHDDPSFLLAELVQAVDKFCTATPHKILFDYLGRSVALETAPDSRFTETQKILDLHCSVPFSTLKEDLEDALENVVNYTRADRWTAPTREWPDILVDKLWVFGRPAEPTPIPSALIYYINQRQSKRPLELLFDGELRPHSTHRLWSDFPITLSNGPSSRISYKVAHQNTREQVMMALWRLVSLGHASYAESNQSVLATLTDNASSSDPPITFSVITIVKALVAKSLPLATKPVINYYCPRRQ
ncbi:hypothetical protein B0H13DRAFT_2493864 [Mycena leptocephala]|nr:hypothetical protein B0H13DRAFT_2493864 [Mycena leptocephala]